MKNIKAFAALDTKSPLKFFPIDRREPRADDVEIDIQYCGVCHSDVHQVRDEWGGSTFPMVPGHEIVGVVKRVGTAVKKFKVGDKVGVGCMVNSCQDCSSCNEGLEQYCLNGFVGTYNGTDKDGALTYGGYSTLIVHGRSRPTFVCRDHYVLSSAALERWTWKKSRRRWPRRTGPHGS